MEGWFHPTAHVWLYTNNGKVLLQKRAAEKDTFPGLWDVSVAGHVHAGETPMEAALREVKEELDMELDSGSLHFLGRFKSEHSHPGGILDREFNYCYLCELNLPIEDIRPEPKEVSALELRSLLQFAEEVWGLALPQRYVPHSREYYGAVIKGLKSRL